MNERLKDKYYENEFFYLCMLIMLLVVLFFGEILYHQHISQKNYDIAQHEIEEYLKNDKVVITELNGPYGRDKSYTTTAYSNKKEYKVTLESDKGSVPKVYNIKAVAEIKR